jgi:hypothetical protein
VVAPDGSSALVATNFTTNNANVVFYWVAGASNQIVQCSATVNGKTVTAQAVFNIMSPLPTFSLQNQGPIAADTNNSDKRLELYFGQNIGTNVGTAMYLTNVPAINGIFYGAYFVTQIINTYAEENVITGTNIYGWQRGGNGLDNQVRYGTPGVGTSVYFSAQLVNNPIWTDSPDVGLGGPVRWVSRSDSFKSYLMFQPTPPSIAVPMYVGTWGWSGSAKTNGATGGILLSHSQITPSVLQTTTFPTWTMVNTNNTPWNVTNLPAFNEN